MKGRFFETLLTHATIVLSVVFLVFFVIDRFNPAMEFIGSELSDWLLCAFCVCAFLSSVLAAVSLYRRGGRREK